MTIILLAYGPCVVIVNLLGQVCTLGRAPRTNETLPDFREWCRVTRHSQVFYGLTGCQRDTSGLGRHKYFLEASHFLLFFVVRNLFLSLRSLLSCFQHSRTNHCPYLRTSKSYFLEASHFLFFLLSNLFFIVMVLEKITNTCFVLSLRSLLSYFQHSRTNHWPYLRTRPIIFSRSITFSGFFCCQTCFLCYGFGNNHIWRCWNQCGRKWEREKRDGSYIRRKERGFLRLTLEERNNIGNKYSNRGMRNGKKKWKGEKET